jgi:hypothetical protein
MRSLVPQDNLQKSLIVEARENLGPLTADTLGLSGIADTMLLSGIENRPIVAAASRII